MSNNTATLTTEAKKTFAVKNPNTGKIVFFLNASQFVDASVVNGLTSKDVEALISQCSIEEFVKSETSDALAGLKL